MANKRTIKKRIYAVCGEAAVDILIGLPHETARPVVIKIAELQGKTISNVSFSFEHTPADYANRREYNTARARYNRLAFKQLKSDFHKGLKDIVEQLNAENKKA